MATESILDTRSIMGILILLVVVAAGVFLANWLQKQTTKA